MFEQHVAPTRGVVLPAPYCALGDERWARRMPDAVIGREREIERAWNVISGTRGGYALVLVGEAGIGKSTIWSALADRAETTARVLGASPSEAEAELPFAVLIDLLAGVEGQVFDDLPEVQRHALEQALRRRSTTVMGDPTAVALAILGILRTLASARPTLLAIDDVQWVDAPSLRAVAFALRRAGDVPVGLLATVRSESESVLAALGEPLRVERIEIPGLADRHLADLILARTGHALTPARLARVARLSGGNPFTAIELVAAGGARADRLPATLAAALRTRLSALSPAARGAGLVAAALGRIDEQLVRRLHGSGLDELWEAGIVDTRHDTPWFVHPLLAEAVLDLHPPAERRAVHLALATALDDPDERALHLAHGTTTRSEAVATELVQAADRLDRRGAPETAAAVMKRAAELTPEDDPVASTRRLIAAADLYSAAGEGEANVLPLLERLAAELAPGPERARVLVRLGWLGAQLDTIPTSEVLEFQRQALAEGGGDAEVATTAHAVLARMSVIGGDFRAALRHAELAVAAGGAPDAQGMFPSPFGELGNARLLTGEGLDERVFQRGIDLEEQRGRIGEPYQSPRLEHALALLYSGELARARVALRALRARSLELGRVRSTAGCSLHLAELEVRAGNLESAEELAHEFRALDRQVRGAGDGGEYPLGLVWMHLGRVDDARLAFENGAATSREIESPTWLAHHLAGLGHLALSAGNPAAARDVLAPVLPMLREASLGEWSVHPVHPDLIESLVGLGELEEAEELTDELEEYGRRLDRSWGLATAGRCRALLTAAREDERGALEAAERALAAHERLDWPFEHGRTLLVSGVIFRRLGRRRDARDRLEAASGIFRSIGNPLWLARVETEIRRLGGRRGDPSALTPTEARVAGLAGEGLRNAEIAARLYVTPKTVEATLSRVYRKLGVRSRTELARRIAEDGVDDSASVASAPRAAS